MNIRVKLTGLFVLILSAILIVSSIVIYLLFSEYREADFYSRLESRATSIAQLLIEVDEIDSMLLKKIEDVSLQNLPEEKIVVYDESFKRIYSNVEEEQLSFGVTFMRKIKESDEIRFKVASSEVLATYFVGTNENAYIIISAVDVFGVRKLNKLGNILIIVCLLGIILAFLSAFFYVKNALTPIHTIINQVDNIGLGNLNSRIDEGNQKDEIAHLAKTFNKMLERLETAFEAQKSFISNASHELKNPLAAIIGQLDVILLKERSAAEYKKTLESIHEDINNVNTISNRLLLLAKASSDFNESSFYNQRIDEILWKARQDVLKRDERNQINIVFNENDFDDQSFNVLGNELLLRTAFLNLMDNGCKYSYNNSVKIIIDSDSKNIKLTFVDKGIGIEQDEVNMIFEPFYRGKNTLGIKGHGIGLSLVSKIVALHKGSISLNTQINKGSEFIVTFPLNRRN